MYGVCNRGEGLKLCLFCVRTYHMDGPKVHRNYLAFLFPATSVVPTDKKKQIKITTTSGKTFKRKRLNGQDADGVLLPIHMEAPVPQKDYNPEAFAGQHASDLFGENCALKSKVRLFLK